MHIQTDRAFIHSNTPTVRYLHVVIAAPAAPGSGAPPRQTADVAMVLDRSGSMGGTKIKMARTAVEHGCSSPRTTSEWPATTRK